MLRYSNLVNTKVAKFIKNQPHGGGGGVLSVKNAKKKKQNKGTKGSFSYQTILTSLAC